MKWTRMARTKARVQAGREADREAWEIRRIAAMPDRPVGDPLSWPLPGTPQEPPALFDALCCPATSPLGGRCERKTGHRTKAHTYALPVDDVLDVRLCVWKDPVRSKVTTG